MAARFDLPVAMTGAVGNDPNGAAARSHLADSGVDVADVAVLEQTTGVASIWVDGSGANRIVIVAGANGHVDPSAVERAVRRIEPAVVVGQFEIPPAATAAAFSAARDVGATTILNPAPAFAINSTLVGLTDWLVPNETEFLGIGGGRLGGTETHEAAAIVALGDRLGVHLVVTLGERGVAVRSTGRDVVRVEAPTVAAVDTTGAGDAFVGAFAVGLAMGGTPVEAARLGCTVAADSVTRRGTAASYASRDAARAMLAAMGAG
jgi:ribokinase